MDSMDQKIIKELLPYQIPHVVNIIKKITQKGICLDGSDTGIGKTYVAMAVAKHLKLQPFILCPKTIISSWEKVADIYGVKPLAVVNYETAHRGKCYDAKGTRIKCQYLDYSKDRPTVFEWKLPANSMLIFDEVHRCCSETTLHGKLLMSTVPIYDTNCPMLLLSATVADDMAHIKTLGVLFKWFKSVHWVPDWMKNKNYNPKHARILIHQKLFPEYGCRLRICELGDNFPKSQLSADCYTVDSKDMIDAAYKDIQMSLQNLKNKTEGDQMHNNNLVKITRARQKIELCKIPLFIDLVQQYRENNYSVVIFLNFTETLKLLADKLKTKCIIFGEQTLKERLKNIEDFMENREKIIICNITAGGESISLHDKHGDHPRVSLISPTWSSNKLVQACGRIHRSDAKTVAVNKIIYTAKTVEQKMCNKLESKLTNLSSITDDDLKLDE